MEKECNGTKAILIEGARRIGKSFVKGYYAVLLEDAVILLACIIFSLFASTSPVIDVNAAVNQVWS